MGTRVSRLMERIKNLLAHSLGMDFADRAQMEVLEKLAGNIMFVLAEQADLIAADTLKPTSVAAKTLREFAALCALSGVEWQDVETLAEAEAIDTGVIAAAVLPDGWLGGK